MTKHILDITASFETHHARSAIVVTKHVESIKQLASYFILLNNVLPIGEATDKTLRDIYESLKDIAEIMDGYKQDMLDVLEAHREYIAKMDAIVKEVIDRK